MRFVERIIFFKAANVRFRIASTKFSTAQTYVEDGCTSPSCLQGIFPEMLFLLQEKLNFTFKVIDEKAAGFKQENGSWTGMIGESMRIRNDIERKIMN